MSGAAFDGGAALEPPSRRRLWAPVAAFALLLVVLSSRPAPVDLGLIPGLDKVVHATYFFLMGFLAVRASLRGHNWSRRRTALTVLVGGLLFGISDEVHQSFVPGRSSSALDVVADVCGTWLAVVTGPELLTRVRLLRG